jgi:hypothetical protein
MRKKLVSAVGSSDATSSHGWLELERVARVEVSSEAEGYPVEGALLKDRQRGWRANELGLQTIRLLFDHPHTIQVIRLIFREQERERTQEFVLRWLPNGVVSWKDIIRQQWNFSPPNTVKECEEYKVQLASAMGLELSIDPDMPKTSLMHWEEARAVRQICGSSPLPVARLARSPISQTL